jgi:hypothetical protein
MGGVRRAGDARFQRARQIVRDVGSEAVADECFVGHDRHASICTIRKREGCGAEFVTYYVGRIEIVSPHRSPGDIDDCLHRRSGFRHGATHGLKDQPKGHDVGLGICIEGTEEGQGLTAVAKLEQEAFTVPCRVPPRSGKARIECKTGAAEILQVQHHVRNIQRGWIAHGSTRHGRIGMPPADLLVELAEVRGVSQEFQNAFIPLDREWVAHFCRVAVACETNVAVKSLAPVGIGIRTNRVKHRVRVGIDVIEVGIPAGILEIEELGDTIRLLLGQRVITAGRKIGMLVTEGVSCCMSRLVRRRCRIIECYPAAAAVFE